LVGCHHGVMTAAARPVHALIVVDVQRAFVTGDHAVPAAASLLEQVTSLLAKARAAGALIVYLQNDGPAGAVDEAGTPGWQLSLPVHDSADEVVIRKTTDDGFHQSGLGELLAARGVRRVAICGAMSEMCVSATARTALTRGLEVVLPHDAHAHATYDIPAAPGISAMVPAAVVSRVAEWALGDQVEVVAEPRMWTLRPQAGDWLVTGDAAGWSAMRRGLSGA
jgi:nicotinamidase-related amidase